MDDLTNKQMVAVTEETQAVGYGKNKSFHNDQDAEQLVNESESKITFNQYISIRLETIRNVLTSSQKISILTSHNKSEFRYQIIKLNLRNECKLIIEKKATI